MQTDLDAYRVRYNTERPHQDRGVKRGTPVDVFVRCLSKPKTPKEEKMKKAARDRSSPGAATVSRLPYLYTFSVAQPDPCFSLYRIRGQQALEGGAPPKRKSSRGNRPLFLHLAFDKGRQ